jgi:RNA polymerase sigma-70 factor (ECF subfamily)
MSTITWPSGLSAARAFLLSFDPFDVRWWIADHSPEPALTDELDLIEAALEGDSAAFGDLVQRYQDRLYSAVVHIVGCRSEAEDVVQDAFVQAFVKLKTFKHNSKFYTWLYRIAVNVSISHRRRRKIQVSVEQSRETTGDEPLDATAPPSDSLEQAERREQLEQALQLLTPEHRTIIVLRHMEEFAYDEMAEILGISVGTVRSRLHRARAQLLEHLKQIMPDEATP